MSTCQIEEEGGGWSQHPPGNMCINIVEFLGGMMAVGKWGKTKDFFNFRRYCEMENGVEVWGGPQKHWYSFI